MEPKGRAQGSTSIRLQALLASESGRLEWGMRCMFGFKFLQGKGPGNKWQKGSM